MTTLGILGDGQLGRMMALSAAEMGIRVHVFGPTPDSPAGQVSPDGTIASFDDTDALQRFARSVDVVTLEWENVPLAALRAVAAVVPAHPGPDMLAVTQDRVAEKTRAQALGVPTPAFRAVDSLQDLTNAVASLGTPAVLKTRRDGYDGKGQAWIRDPADVESAWNAIGQKPAILEQGIPFTAECSVILARDVGGAITLFPVTRNHHHQGILRRSFVPSGLDPSVDSDAQAAATRLAEALGYVGLMAVEFFVTEDGVLFNEIAPRPHNSGHWTIEACAHSQFDCHVRAVCGLGLPADPGLLVRGAEMLNLLGDEALKAPQLLSAGDAHVHLYGKAEIKPGRKMGHVTRLLRF